MNRIEVQFDDGMDPRATYKEFLIPQKQPIALNRLEDCDTLHLLYLLQIACDLHRQWVMERNQYFASISRADRFIDHVDAPMLITNLLKWHHDDEIRNVFEGWDILEKSAISVVAKFLCGVGMFPFQTLSIFENRWQLRSKGDCA